MLAGSTSQTTIGGRPVAVAVKLATIAVKEPKSESGRVDGRLAIVSAGDSLVLPVPRDVAPNMLAALRDWEAVQPELMRLDAALRDGGEPGMAFADVRFLAPLPRSTCWIDGSAYIQHIILVRKARGAPPPDDLRTVPLMYQGASDPMLPWDADIEGDEAWGMDFEAEVAVILDAVPRGTRPEAAVGYVRLVCLMNDVSLRNLIPRELAAGFGFFHGKPPSAFAPFAVTPGHLGAAWQEGRVHLDMETDVNGERFGRVNAGPEMFFGFGELIAHAAKTRPLPAGTVLGSGTVSNEDPSVGQSCIAERRMLETIQDGEPKTPFLRHGDRVQIDMKQDGVSVFGALDQRVRAL